MMRFWTPFKVGLLTIVAIVSLLYGVSRVTKGGMSSDEGYTVFAIFDDASGLRAKSRVQIAGIEVGQIEEVELVGSRAKITLRIDHAILLYLDARVSKKSEGFIGDMALEIVPGSDDQPRIVEGGEIKNVVSMGNIEKVFATLGSITEDIEAMTRSLRDLLANDEVGGVRKIIDDLGQLTAAVNLAVADAGIQLKSIMGDVKNLTSSMSSLATGETGNIQKIIHNVEEVSREIKITIQAMQQALGTVNAMLGSNEGDIKEGVAGLRQSLEKINTSLDEINTVTGKLAAGDSTIGRLLTDDTLIREVEEMVEGAGDFIDRIIRLQTEVTLRSEFHLGAQSARNSINLRLIPKEDKWYEITLVSPPLGVTAVEDVTTIVDDGAGGFITVTTTTRVEKETIKFNVLFAHRWRWDYFSVSGKFGLIENSGGLAGGIGLFGDHLNLDLEIFEFSNDDLQYPKLRAFVTWTFFNHLFITAGVDDAFNLETRPPARLRGTPQGDLFIRDARDFFVGGGFYFTDDDLKTILTTVGIPGA